MKAAVLVEKSGAVGMNKKKFFGFIPKEILQPEQYLIANHCNWTVTIHEDKTDEDTCNDESKQMDIDGELSFLEKIPS